MNLVTEPWIPVVGRDGGHRLASLEQVFAEGRQFADLAVRPHERVALMRLLICIGQTALDGPEEYYDDWINAPKTLPGAAEQYLDARWQSFNLFDSEKPFLQIAQIEKSAKNGKSVEEGEDSSESSAGKLDFALTSGSNTTLFDHLGSLPEREFSLPQLAIDLITFLNFSPGGLYSQVQWKGQVSKKAGNPHAPCLPSSMLHAFIRRDTLFDTRYAPIY
jgi:CRISPR system Cascade subunit CasA